MGLRMCTGLSIDLMETRKDPLNCAYFIIFIERTADFGSIELGGRVVLLHHRGHMSKLCDMRPHLALCVLCVCVARPDAATHQLPHHTPTHTASGGGSNSRVTRPHCAAAHCAAARRQPASHALRVERRASASVKETKAKN